MLSDLFFRAGWAGPETKGRGFAGDLIRIIAAILAAHRIVFCRVGFIRLSTVNLRRAGKSTESPNLIHQAYSASSSLRGSRVYKRWRASVSPGSLARKFRLMPCHGRISI